MRTATAEREDASIAPPVAAVNGRFLDRPVTGVERYATEVTRRLGPRLRTVRPPRGAHGALGHLWEQCALPRKVGPDELLWSPANTGPVGLENQVVTIHDASPLDHPEWFHGAFARFYRRMMPRLIRRARRVITSSRFSRDRLAEAGGVEAERVVVVTPGVDRDHFRPPSAEEVAEARRRFDLPDAYLLAVGSLSPRKNLRVLVSAWERLRAGRRDLELVIVGEPAATAPAGRTGPYASDIRFPGRVSDEDLPLFYGCATAFVFPSVYEGFGLPILEAMACGTPVVASRRAGIPEAVGEAGLLFDPLDSDDLAAVLERVLDEEPLRRQMMERGLRRARDLTWEATANAVLRTLSEVSS